MIKRKMINGNKVTELEFPVTLTICTKCPEKWKLIDLETGEEYIGVLPFDRKKDRHWKKIK
jgi:hypothetical protein